MKTQKPASYIGNPETRHRAGEGHPWAKLTQAQVDEIRAALSGYRTGMYSQLAREYGVAVNTIRSIAQGISWATPAQPVAYQTITERLAKFRKYYQDNAEACRERRQRYVEKHREQCNAAVRRYYQANKERLKEYQKQHRAIKRQQALNTSGGQQEGGEA